MIKEFHLPIRMCICCRKKDIQSSLNRFQCIDGGIVSFSKNGRSFYLCNNCLNQEKQVIKSLMRQCKSGARDKFMNQLKEIIADGRKS